MNKIITLKNKLRVSYEYLPHVHSVCFGVFVLNGSRYEDKEHRGISHLIEHMIFKGTEKRTAFDIVADTDKMGANFNAYTSKENTVFYIQSIVDYAERCVEILSDMLINHTFPEDELEREKEVVVQEINMCEDAPDDLCQELSALAFWGEDQLGQTILGTEDEVRSISREKLHDYCSKKYVAENIVISVAGNIDEGRAIELIEKYFTFKSGEENVCPVAVYPEEPKAIKSIKPIEQANICLVFPAVGNDTLEGYKYSVMSSILGSNMSSVLFQRIREKLGLAYSVYSYLSSYANAGAFCIYLGTSPAKVKLALTEINNILNEYYEHGFSADEFERGFMQVKSAYLMGLDSPLALMRVNGRKALNENLPFDIEGIIEYLDSITLGDINSIFRKCFARKPSIGYVGQEQDFDMISVFDER